MDSKKINLSEIGEIVLQKSRRNKRLRLCIKSCGKIKVSIPEYCEFKQAEDFVKKHRDWIIRQLDRIERLKQPEDAKPEAAIMHADVYLPERIKFLSQKTGLKYKKLKLVNVKSYWGKCMGDNSISLNVQLMRLPDELIDYVILHELAHVKVKNHSPRFYDFLSTLVPEPRRLSKTLRKYSLAGCLR